VPLCRNSHAPPAAHFPVRPQALLPVSLGHAPPDSSPAGTESHVPTPLTLHRWHVPHDGVVQHTPSTQLSPLAHCPLPLHGPPGPCLPQVMSAPQAPCVQCMFEVQLVRHWVPFSLQVYCPHRRVTGAGQVPLPSQVAASVSTPPAHEAARQEVPESLRQAPAPLQKPSFPQGSEGTGMHMPLGSAPPLGTLLHVPTAPATLQLLQLSVQALLQHTPSTQLPDMHSVPTVHWLPATFLPQLLALHCPGGTHCASAVHEVKHADPAPAPLQM
jgi:hypothetical protein